MKSLMKKSFAFLLALTMLLSADLLIPQNATEVQAASYAFRSEDCNKTVYYIPQSVGTQYIDIDISGYPKATAIKSVSVNKAKNAFAYAKRGAVRVYFKGTGTVKVSCKVGGKTLKTNLYVKKYSNPFKSVKLGSTNFTSRFNATNYFDYYHTNVIKNKKLTITMKKGWKVYSVYTYNGGSSKSQYGINKSSYSMKNVSLNKSKSSSYDHIEITLVNTSQNLTYQFDLNGYMD